MLRASSTPAVAQTRGSRRQQHPSTPGVPPHLSALTNLNQSATHQPHQSTGCADHGSILQSLKYAVLPSQHSSHCPNAATMKTQLGHKRHPPVLHVWWALVGARAQQDIAVSEKCCQDQCSQPTSAPYFAADSSSYHETLEGPNIQSAQPVESPPAGHNKVCHLLNWQPSPYTAPQSGNKRRTAAMQRPARAPFISSGTTPYRHQMLQCRQRHPAQQTVKSQLVRLLLPPRLLSACSKCCCWPAGRRQKQQHCCCCL